MTAEQLRNSILQEAISGRLVPQDPNDEPAEIVSTVPEDEVPFEIPSTWRWVFLKDCAAIIGGYAFPSASIKGEKGVRVIRISDINEKGFVNKSVVRYNGHENLDKFKIIPQDILIAMTGGTVGKSLFVMQIEEDMLLNQRVAIIRNNGQYAPYLDIVVKSPHIKSFINDKKNSTNDNISMGDINNFLIPLPPLAEQKRIVAKLEELLPIVEQYGKAQKELDELNAALPARLRQSILQEAISGRLVPQDPNDEPAAALLQRIREEKARLVKEGKLKKKDLVETPITDDEKPFEIPDNWEWVRLGEITSYRRGSFPQPYTDITSYGGENSMPFVQVADVDENFYRLKNKTKKTISQKAMPFSVFVPIGTVVVTLQGSIGKVAITQYDSYVDRTLAIFNQIYGQINKMFFSIVLKNKFENEALHARGATIKTITKEEFQSFILPLPPLPEQQRIVAKIEELFAEIDKLK